MPQLPRAVVLGALAALSEEARLPLLPWDHLPAPILPVSHDKGPFPTSSDEGSGLRTWNRGAEAVTQPAQLATEQRRLSRWPSPRYGGSLARLTASCPGLLITTFSAAGCLPLEPGVTALLRIPSTLGPWPPPCAHTSPTEEPWLPLPCAPHPALASPPGGLRSPLSCHVDPRTVWVPSSCS